MLPNSKKKKNTLINNLDSPDIIISYARNT